ncbi:MAG: PE family protein [Mycobacterium sp.]|uniref:PE domain-containing protein n=1 Tax=Mycobacterium sp. TaxID=1785 RepID=UPI003C76710E
MTFAMVPEAVGLSASTEAGLAAETGAAAAAVAAALLDPTPMGMDADSAKFAVIAAGAGAMHVATAEQHGLMRGLYSGAQSLAMTTTVATELMRAAATAI